MIHSRSRHFVRLFLLSVSPVLAPLPATGAPAPPARQLLTPQRCPLADPGVIVEAAPPQSPAARAGIQAGDRIDSWCRIDEGSGGCGARGAFVSPFDWRDVELEQAQRGRLLLEGTRASMSLHWTIERSSLGLTVAPHLRGGWARSDEIASALERAGKFADAARELERATSSAVPNSCAALESWLLARAALQRSRARQWKSANADFSRAVARARERNATHLEARLQMAWWEALYSNGNAKHSGQHLERALLLERNRRTESLFLSLVQVRLGKMAEENDDLGAAERWTRQAHAIALRLAPGSRAESAATNNLAALVAMRGDLAQAQALLARDLEICADIDPGGQEALVDLWNIGELMLERGDMAAAEAAFLRAKSTLDSSAPAGREMATTLHLLGRTALMSRDLDAAENLFQRQLAILERLDPAGRGLRDSLIDLSELAFARREGERTEALWRRVVALDRQLNPEGPRSAQGLVGLGEALRLRGRLEEAEKTLSQALAIWRRLNPAALATGSIHQKIGVLQLQQGRLGDAEAHLREALRIHQENGAPLAEGYQALARLQAERGQAQQSSATYGLAIEALETQESRLGGARESRWLYGSSLGDLYFEAAAHQIDQARPEEAWALLERGRARDMREGLARRDPRPSGETQAPLEVARRRLHAEYDRVQNALSDWVPAQGKKRFEALRGRQRDLRAELGEVERQIARGQVRGASPGNFTAFDLSSARAALDPGTLLLSYAIGESRSFLFVLAPAGARGPGFLCFPLAIGREGLHAQVKAFRALVGDPDTPIPDVKRSGLHLYDLLLGPAEPLLAQADRWLISPDGPLHSLPFGALSTGGRYLAESKPIHIVASAAVYEELKAARTRDCATPAIEMLAVGDPRYRPAIDSVAATVPDPPLQGTGLRGLKLTSLPDTRVEVEAISRLVPRPRALLGAEATEEAVKSLAPQARRIHFACHGLLDEKLPLNSALALSTPEPTGEGGDNGLLQAWEILEEMHLRADLVTLSACDSGLGREMGAEGLIGLVRAFQLAGARSVVGSLWSVADGSTARFMARFYGALYGGSPKDEALRQAQLALIGETSGFSHPFYWGAFELFGDWR